MPYLQLDGANVVRGANDDIGTCLTSPIVRQEIGCVRPIISVLDFRLRQLLGATNGYAADDSKEHDQNHYSHQPGFCVRLHWLLHLVSCPVVEVSSMTLYQSALSLDTRDEDKVLREIGAGEGIRTPGGLLGRQVLYQPELLPLNGSFVVATVCCHHPPL
jgi:hypothetical protein